MPYKHAHFHHCRQLDPNLFDKPTLKNVPVSHNNQTKYLEDKYPNAEIITGQLKSTRKWEVQSILIPLTKKESEQQPSKSEFDPFCEANQIHVKKKGD